MISAIELLTKLRSIVLFPIGFPNGKQTHVVKEGILYLGKNIYL